MRWGLDLTDRMSGGTRVKLSSTEDVFMSEMSTIAFAFALQIAFVKHQL